MNRYKYINEPKRSDYQHWEEFTFRKVKYSFSMDTITGNLVLTIPSRVLIMPRLLMTDLYPEIQYMSNMKLIGVITDYLIDRLKDQVYINETPPKHAKLPLEIRPLEFRAGEDHYRLSFDLSTDLVFLEIPMREINANYITMESHPMELNAMYDGKLQKHLSRLVKNVMTDREI